MHMRAALALAACLLLTASVSGCLGVDNMAQLKAAMGFGPEPLQVEPPIARARASLTFAAVGQPIAFSAHGSLDPQGLPLEYRWDFGDGGRAQGAEATHSYPTGGFYTATLRVANPIGAEGLDSVLLTIVDNRPPTAAFDVLRGDAPVERALVGEPLRFEAQARDPEGHALTLRWDFGDGTTALTSPAEHRYERAGRYTVTLRVEDPDGLAATASRGLGVDETRTHDGRVALGDDRTAFPVDIAPEAQFARATLRFDPQLGLNALTLTLVDAQGQEVGRAPAQPGLLARDASEATLDVTADALARHAPGAWSWVIERTSGLESSFTLTAEVHY
jgi:chitodextrinase